MAKKGCLAMINKKYRESLTLPQIEKFLNIAKYFSD